MTVSDVVQQSRQLLPSILESRAQADPDRVWAKFPVSPTSYSEGFRSATYGQVRNAVNRVAWILHEEIGTSSAFETVAYLGPNDLRYHIVLLAAVKTGHKAFFPSPRNSIVAQTDLLSRLECKVLVTTDPQPPFVGPILQKCSMKIVHIPSLNDLLNTENAPLYPYNKTFDESKDDPIFVLHTSGSTGIPKPMIYTHDYASRVYRANSLPAPESMARIDDLFLQGIFFSFLPGFHIAGIGWGLILPMFGNSVPVLPLPGRPPSTDGFLEALAHGEFDWAFLLPVIINELSQDAASLDLVASKLQYLFYTGGSLPQEAGEVVAPRIPIYSGLGSSECAAFPQVRVADKSFTEPWKYLCINPIVRPEFRHRMDDLHEFVIVKSSECPEAQPVFALFPDLDEYETRDLFSPHPSIPGLWRHRGRRDDIIVFLNGEKTNPISFEEEVSGHPDVRAALVAGSQRFEACLLIETTGADPLTAEKKNNVIDRIWPTVEDANRRCPAHARISRSKILIVDPCRPMLRAGKGTVQREGTLRLYSSEIDALYHSPGVAAGAEQEQLQALPSSKKEGIQQLRALVSNITSWGMFQDDADFFVLGMDSLQVLQLSSAFRSRFGLSSISPAVIYKSPSVELLIQHLYPDDARDPAKGDRTVEMARLLQIYERRIDELSAASRSIQSTQTSGTQRPGVVVLTGSTGTIGSYILQELLANAEISHIYCLNRSADSQSKQQKTNLQQRLASEIPPDRVTFLTADLTKASLGLHRDVYQDLLNTATQIIHNAWPVDFNQSLTSFQPSLDGVLRLVSFAQLAQNRPSLIFLSSISAVSEYHQVPDGENLVPERIIEDLRCPASMGYGESKYLAERILDYAAKQIHIPCGVARIGQVSGTAKDPHGWKRNEWLPSLILSSRHLQKLPESLGSIAGHSGGPMDSIDWVPVDELGAILVELSATLYTLPAKSGAQVFHCVNPCETTWTELIPTVIEALKDPKWRTDDTDIATVGFHEWLGLLQASADVSHSNPADQTLQENPGIKLLQFYEQLLGNKTNQMAKKLSVAQTIVVSKSLKSLRPIQPAWVRGWILEWVGDLQA